MTRATHLTHWVEDNWTTLRDAILVGAAMGWDKLASVAAALKWTARLRATFAGYSIAEISDEWSLQTLNGPNAAALRDVVGLPVGADL